MKILNCFNEPNTFILCLRKIRSRDENCFAHVDIARGQWSRSKSRCQPALKSLGMFQCLLVYSLWEREQNLYPAMVRKLYKPQLFGIGSQCFSGLLYPSTFPSIHSITFWEFDIETPTKILIYLLKIIIICSQIICNLVLYFPSLL